MWVRGEQFVEMRLFVGSVIKNFVLFENSLDSNPSVYVT